MMKSKWSNNTKNPNTDYLLKYGYNFKYNTTPDVIVSWYGRYHNKDKHVYVEMSIKDNECYKITLSHMADNNLDVIKSDVFYKPDNISISNENQFISWLESIAESY